MWVIKTTNSRKERIRAESRGSAVKNDWSWKVIVKNGQVKYVIKGGEREKPGQNIKTREINIKLSLRFGVATQTNIRKFRLKVKTVKRGVKPQVLNKAQIAGNGNVSYQI